MRFKVAEKIIQVLLVDDEPELMENIGHFFKKFFTVWTAESGEEALKIAKNHSFDVLVSDFRLPGMDGLELIDKIVSTQEICKTILTTGQGDVKLAIKALRSGVSDLLPKPISLNELKNSILNVYEASVNLKSLSEIKREVPTIENTWSLLIVDDDRENILRVKDLFKDSLQIFLADTAEEAIKMVLDHPIDIIITDMRLPGMHGIQFIEEVNTIRDNIQCIIVTAYGDFEDVLVAIRNGNVIDYIEKPLDQDLLQVSVRKCLEKLKQDRSPI